MRKLIVLVALSLGAVSARAQAPTSTVVTKLPGEEKLSIRERAERDFLMPVRRKKATELAKQPTASAESVTTSAPENDALTTYNEAAADPRPEAETAVAENTEAALAHARAARHAAYLAARRERLAEERAAERRAEERAEARRAARHSSSKNHSAKAKHTSKSSKSSSSSKKSKSKHHATESHHSTKSSAHKSGSHKSSESGSSKSKHKTASTKTKSKSAKHKRR